MKKSIAKVICLMLCLSLVLTEAEPVFAASSVSDIANRLEQMSQVSKYRDASYTSFDGKGWGAGCYAFVYALSYELFGTGIPSQKSNSAGRYTRMTTNKNWYEVGGGDSNDEVKALLRSAQPGDIIQYSSQAHTRHIVMVFSVSANGIRFWSSNGSKGAHFVDRTWDRMAGAREWNKAKKRWDNVGFGDFDGNGYGMGLYRCKKDIKTGEVGTVSVAFSNYDVRKLTDTSAEPYATATATNGLVKKVGMWIGTSEDDLQVLGTDNGKAGAKKNMWYNTTKYNYPLQPGTTYCYQPFAEVNGKLYKGDIQYFTTTGTKPVGSAEPKACDHSYNSSGRCTKCGQEYPMTVMCLTSPVTYETVKDDVPLRERPYAPDAIVKSLPKGKQVTVVESGENALENLWYKLDNGLWVYSKNVKKVEQSQQPAGCNGSHTKGEYQFCEELHPHKVYWTCASCGELFTDGSTKKLDACETCNPKPISVTFSNYKVRELAATSAEPYATAEVTKGNGKVTRVGMMIGTSKDSLTQLGTDNGTPKPLKNMWYNTTKYGYELKPNTTYYYQPFAEVDGNRFYGDIKSFTTPDDEKSSATVTFSNYKVRKLTATSAEPYATATASSGKVARVGMMIGTSKDSLTQLGTDNGTPKPLKNMWYNTTKYGYTLTPNTTYYYQPFAEVDGNRFYGDIKSFTTPAK